ncbi:MAG: phage tail sheath family protein [Anaerolineaceae bacterium]|nr:phage tail sheath family protein [Anaerolineaceae bacterium]
MAQYLSPGVYVEEVPSGSAPIAGAGTSTAGFIGFVANDVIMPNQPGVFKLKDGTQELTTDGNPIPVPYEIAETGKPQLITSWMDFKNKFGDVQEKNNILGNAVYGFFNNGGTRCWVARVSNLEDTDNEDQVKDALANMEAIDEIAILAVPISGVEDIDRRVAIRSMALEHCKKMGDRFAILDGEESIESSPTQASIYSDAAGNAMGMTSDYGAVYFPWIDVSGKGDFVPPSGHIAGVYARVDGERGVHKAPANEVIRGARAVKYRVSKPQQDGLNPDGINIIRQFNGNITVWGARTIGGDKNGEWKYLSVRRLFLFLRESIDEGTQWVVFEPNTPDLWAKITRNVVAFLTVVWRAGALFGSTPEEAFYVKCDAETNPPELRDLGQVVTEIGVAVVKPAEFVIFRISQWAGPGN